MRYFVLIRTYIYVGMSMKHRIPPLLLIWYIIGLLTGMRYVFEYLKVRLGVSYVLSESLAENHETSKSSFRREVCKVFFLTKT
jgi:hypothetical protein